MAKQDAETRLELSDPNNEVEVFANRAALHLSGSNVTFTFVVRRASGGGVVEPVVVRRITMPIDGAVDLMERLQSLGASLQKPVAN
ncbi:MAG: hypothetical protein GY788_14975 [bacterium]|nr:hypothetical protein [bacterium]